MHGEGEKADRCTLEGVFCAREVFYTRAGGKEQDKARGVGKFEFY